MKKAASESGGDARHAEKSFSGDAFYWFRRSFIAPVFAFTASQITCHCWRENAFVIANNRQLRTQGGYGLCILEIECKVQIVRVECES
jgi:hypothetical protein